MGYNLLINGVYWGYNPPILTIDPNKPNGPSKIGPGNGFKTPTWENSGKSSTQKSAIYRRGICDRSQEGIYFLAPFSTCLAVFAR